MSMEVVSARSALLSNYEVLTLLKELESEQLVQQRTAIRIKKEEEERIAAGLIDPSSSTLPSIPPQDEVYENLRTVEFEAIQYLTADYQPTKYQSPESIRRLVHGLNHFDLTKAEKLQIVNLAPTEAVELYVIVEEIEDRLGDAMDDVLEVVRNSVTKPLFLPTEDEPRVTSIPLGVENNDKREDRPGWREDEGGIVGDEFDDMGAGAGVEGDLEMGEDE